MKQRHIHIHEYFEILSVDYWNEELYTTPLQRSTKYFFPTPVKMLNLVLHQN